MKAWLLVLAACGDPNAACPQSNIASGGGCAAPELAITVDGYGTDWDLLPPVTCATCGPADVMRIRGARTLDQRVAILVEFPSGAATDDMHSYRITLGPLDGPLYLFGIRAQVNNTSMTLNDVPITGLPLATAFGPALELALPTAALPFSGGFGITAGLEMLSGTEWVAAEFSTRNATICFDPSSSLCQANAL